MTDDKPEVTRVVTQTTYYLRQAPTVMDPRNNTLWPYKIVVETREQGRRAVVHGRVHAPWNAGKTNFNLGGYDAYPPPPDWLKELLEEKEDTMTNATVQPGHASAAYAGSYYTIVGAGGDLMEWVNGYQALLDDQKIGKPRAWYVLTGAQVNEFARPANPRDAFQDDLTILVFPLDGLNTAKLALFKIRMSDRWFDDVVDNMKSPVTP